MHSIIISHETKKKLLFTVDSFYLAGTMHALLKREAILSKDSAGIAQLVEHNLAKVGVASSNLVSRSNFSLRDWVCTFWRNGRMAMQRIANPWISVRLRVPPPLYLRNVVSTRCPGGEIGRHKGFKIPRS